MINAYRTKAEIFIPLSVAEDAFGGFTTELTSVGIVNAYLTQTKETLTVTNGKNNKRVIAKLTTTESIPHNVTQVICDNKTYDVLNFIDHKKAIILELVEVQSG